MKLISLNYSFRNLTRRSLQSLAAMTVIGLVVVCCSLLLGLQASLDRSISVSSHPLNQIVLRRGAENDGTSQVSLEAYRWVVSLEGVALGDQGQPLVSPELVVQPYVYTVAGGRENVLVRGVKPVALKLRENARIAQGRMIVPSSGEAVVGKKLLSRYAGAEIGAEIEFGRRSWAVVGVLEDDGSTLENEIWVDARELAQDANRSLPYSGIRLRAENEARAAEIATAIDLDRSRGLEAISETELYASQSESGQALEVLVLCLALLAGPGAAFGAANCLYAAVASRRREIGTLRALGFSPSAVLVSLEIEALFLSFGGFALGLATAIGIGIAINYGIGGIAFPATETFSTQVLQFEITPRHLGIALLIALLIGAGGGLGPAWRASRLRPVEALRIRG